jgi:cytochrome P450
VDADIVKEIFVRQFANFVNRPDTLRFEQNLARLRDNDWKEIRRIMNPVFTTKKLKTLAHMINDAENVLLEVLEEKASRKESVPAYKTAQGLSFQIITKTAFAMDVDCQRNENNSFYLNIKAWLNYPFSALVFLILMFPGLGSFFRFFNRFDKRYRFWDEIDAHIRGIIGFRRSQPQGVQDLLGLMLEAAEGKNQEQVSRELTTNILKEPEEEEGHGTEKVEVRKQATGKAPRYLMTDTQMVDNLILFLAAGFDSTSNT